MSTVRWVGNARAINQVDTVTPGGTWEVDDVINFTINGKILSIVAGDTVIANICANIVTAWTACTFPEFLEITASVSGSTVLLTSVTAGTPFTCAVATTETGGGAADSQTITESTTTSNSSPNDWSLALNWSTGSVPVSTDSVYIEDSSVSILYGLGQSAVTLTLLSIGSSFTGTIGLPDYNPSGYEEYRTTILALSATTIKLGYGINSGSSQIRLNTGSVQTAITVYGTGNPLSPTLSAFQWKGTHSSNTLEVLKGFVSVAKNPGETSTVSAKIGYITNSASDSNVVFGSGVTIGSTFAMSGGVVEINSALTTVNQTGGTLTVLAGGITTLNTYSGVTYYNTSGGTIATALIGAKGKLDFSQDMNAKTITNVLLIAAGGELSDPFGVVAYSAGYKPDKCRQKDITVDTGFNRVLTPA